RRKLSPQNRNPAPNRPRPAASTRNNHRKHQIVAPRQSRRRNQLASVKQTRLTFRGRDHFLILIVALLIQIVALHSPQNHHVDAGFLGHSMLSVDGVH
ncbi:MAG: hypothetical protein ACP5NP_08455, partial [Acetobacteraceae bacterium]